MFRKLKFYYNRITKGWSDEDVWDVGYYLDKIIPPMVRKLKEGCGCPSELYDDAKKNDECHRWKEVLEEIAQGFEAHNAIHHGRLIKLENGDGTWTDKIDEEREKQLTKKYKRGMELFMEYHSHLWY